MLATASRTTTDRSPRPPAELADGAGRGGDEPRVQVPDVPHAGAAVDVDGHAIPLREAEHDVEVAHGVAVERARVDAADDVGAGAQRVLEHLRRALLAEQPGLREGDDLHLRPVAVRLARGEHGLQPLQPGVDVDLRERAHPRRPARDHEPERVRDPLDDPDLGVAPVLPVVEHHRPDAGTAGVRPEGQAQAGRVQVHVHVGEGRQQQPAAAVHPVGMRCRRLCPRAARAVARRGGAHLGDGLALDPDVGRCGAPRAHVADPHGRQG